MPLMPRTPLPLAITPLLAATPLPPPAISSLSLPPPLMPPLHLPITLILIIYFHY
jgi:hypothetical protein